jgi:hypothetical protein
MKYSLMIAILLAGNVAVAEPSVPDGTIIRCTNLSGYTAYTTDPGITTDAITDGYTDLMLLKDDQLDIGFIGADHELTTARSQSSTVAHVKASPTVIMVLITNITDDMSLIETLLFDLAGKTVTQSITRVFKSPLMREMSKISLLKGNCELI